MVGVYILFAIPDIGQISRYRKLRRHVVCYSAFPDHLNTYEKQVHAFPDDSEYGPLWKKWCLFIKPKITFGPRDIHPRHRWREFPMTLFACFKGGPARFEWDTETGYGGEFHMWVPYIIWQKFSMAYLSRIQYNVDFMVQIQWPLFFAIKIGDWFGYIGFKRDADRIYILGAHIGRGAK